MSSNRYRFCTCDRGPGGCPGLLGNFTCNMNWWYSKQIEITRWEEEPPPSGIDGQTGSYAHSHRKGHYKWRNIGGNS
jgi:hypothetical protein